MRAKLGSVDIGTAVTLELGSGMLVTISNHGHVEVKPDGDSRFGYFFDLPEIDTVAGACSARYTEEEQMYGGHGELPGFVTVHHRH